jgi:serum/glucocorticoid-regulated kinase 2
VIYRDLKPENILVDEEGHLRLTDFGLSKMNFRDGDIATSFCGSPEYMSPEMLNNSGHNKVLDFYCLGALLYEMLTGLPPHYNNNRFKMYQSILTKTVSYPSYLNKDTIDIMERLLNKNPKERLGS